MKKLLTNFTGGQPIFYPDDLEHIQIGLLESIVEIVKTNLVNTTDPNILNGIVVGSPPINASTTAGSIYWNGEVYLVDAQNLIGNGSLYWEIVETFLAFNPVQFADGNSRNIHAIRKLGITYINPNTNGFLHSDLRIFKSIASVSAAIVAETNARINNDNIEIQVRSNNDATLQANINAEATSRTTQDTALQVNISAEATSRATALNLKMDIAKTEYLLADIVTATVSSLSGTLDMFITRSANGHVNWQGSFSYGSSGFPTLTINSQFSLKPNRELRFLGYALTSGNIHTIVLVTFTTAGVISFTTPFGIGSNNSNSGTIYFNCDYYIS